LHARRLMRARRDDRRPRSRRTARARTERDGREPGRRALSALALSGSHVQSRSQFIAAARCALASPAFCSYHPLAEASAVRRGLTHKVPMATKKPTATKKTAVLKKSATGGKKLIIAEKPSVANDIARVLGG